MTDVLYAARGGSETTSDLYTVDAGTAAVSSVGPIGFAVTGLAFDPTDDTLYGVTSSHSAASPFWLITIDTSTGAGTAIGDLFSTVIPDIAFDSTGQMYGYNFGGGNKVAKIDKTTGILTNLGSSGIIGSNSGGGIAINSSDVCYLFPKGSTNTYYTVNLTSGAASSAGTLDGSGSGTKIHAAGFDGSDVCWAVNGDGASVSELDTIAVGTGVKTLIGALTPGGGKWDALAWSGDVGSPTGAQPEGVSIALNDPTLEPAPTWTRIDA